MSLNRSLRRLPGLTWWLLALSLLAAIFAGWWVRDLLIERDRQQMHFAAVQLTGKIEERLNAYSLVLRAGAGLLASTGKATREDWRQFVDTLRISDSLKGVQGFGFSLLLTPEKLEQHQQRVRSEGFADYAVSPAGEREVYSAIVFLEPLNELNRRALGYDMYAEPVRRSAMQQARDTGMAALSGRVTLVQETGIDPQHGTLMYVPVYRPGAPLYGPEQRRAALLGWSYSPYRMNDLMQGILGDWGNSEGVRRAIGVRLYDGEVSDETLLFSNLPATAQISEEWRQTLDFNGRRWILEFAPQQEGGPSLLTAWLVALGVLLMGVLILSLYLSLHFTRRNANRIARRLTSELRELASRHEAVVSRVPGMVYSYRLFPDGRSCFPYASGAIMDVYGVTPEQVIDDATPVLNVVHPEDYQQVLQSILDSAAKLTPWRQEYRTLQPDGRVEWLAGDALPQRDEQGVVTWYGVISRITEHKQAEQRLQQALVEAARFRDALDRMDTYVVMKDSELRYTYANQAVLYRFGMRADELLGTRGEAVFDRLSLQRLGDLDRRVLKGERVTEEVEISIRGERGTFMQIKTPIYEDENSQQIVGLISITTDITRARQQANEIERLAHYDALTGLPNRALLSDRLNQAMAMVDRRDSALAVVYLDLDGFKSVNDSYGHSVGDQVLISVAQRMRKALRKEDTLSRLGGDEFVAVLMDMSDQGNYQEHLQRLLKAASRPVLLEDKVIRLSASLGVTFYPQAEPQEGEQLVRQADQAMYQAKLAGKNRFHLFDTEQDRSARSQHETVEHVRLALQRGELRLHYQPKVNMRSSDVIGVEALLRWQHPQRGLLAPGAFIGLVESTPLMLEIGRWVLDSVLQQMDEWLQQGIRLPVSINISAVELRSPDFLSQLQQRLADWPQIDPSMLELEVLETAALGDLAQVARLLGECRALGVSIAIDDFGTGYSSLTYFKRLPARVVKIDQSFVMGILRDPADLAILDGIVRLADALDRQIIAEGVETAEHAEMLLRIGCDYAQGYGIARPMPAADLLPWLQGWRAPEHWARLLPVSRQALPSLYAGVDHRAWVERFRRYLHGEESEMALGVHDCRFSEWLDRQPDGQPKIAAIRSLHQRMHELAEQIDQLNRSGHQQQIGVLLDAMELINEQLFQLLRNLVESFE